MLGFCLKAKCSYNLSPIIQLTDKQFYQLCQANQDLWQVEVYRLGQAVEVLENPDSLSRENILPGFILKLAPLSVIAKRTGKCQYRIAETPKSSMSQQEAILAKVLSEKSDTDIPFTQLWYLLNYLGFKEHLRGSHYIFTKDGVEEILNLQHKRGKAKAYQVKQVRTIVVKYKLGNQNDTSL